MRLHNNKNHIYRLLNLFFFLFQHSELYSDLNNVAEIIIIDTTGYP